MDTSDRLPLPRWAGKALGAAAALIFAPATPTALVWWLVAGIAVGHLMDLVLARGSAGRPRRRATPPPNGGAASAGDPWSAADASAAAQFAFAALGRLASLADRTDPQQLRTADALMDALGFDADSRREALVWLHAGRDDSFPFDAVAAAAAPELAARPSMREAVVDALTRMSALADTPEATAALLDLGTRAGMNRETLALRAVAAAALAPERSAEAHARETLGVLPDDSEDVIRLAYRRLVSRCHPDRLGPNANEQERALAQRRMWELREALETLVG